LPIYGGLRVVLKGEGRTAVNAPGIAVKAGRPGGGTGVHRLL